MEERHNTLRENYNQKYPAEKLAQSYILCAEAIGYLKSLEEYLPSEQKWIESEKTALMLVLWHMI